MTYEELSEKIERILLSFETKRFYVESRSNQYKYQIDQIHQLYYSYIEQLPILNDEEISDILIGLPAPSSTVEVNRAHSKEAIRRVIKAQKDLILKGLKGE